MRALGETSIAIIDRHRWLWLTAAVVLSAGCVQGARGLLYNPAGLDSLRGGGSALVPQECGPDADFGGIGNGAQVVLHRQRPVKNDRNWVAGMYNFVGSTTSVTALAGRDPAGCPVVHVAVDEGRYAWRVRDLTLIGRDLGPGGGDAVPQRCGEDQDSTNVGLLQPGAVVILRRHRRVDSGDDNWTDEMSDFVGRQAVVVAVGGVDGEGCPVFHVDIDHGEWAWRVRSASLVRPALPQACGEGATSRDHGAVKVDSTVRLSHHRPVRGERNWSASMEQYVDRVARVTSLGPPDDQGCPVVRVDADRGARPWRVRDLVLLETSGTSTAARARRPGGNRAGQAGGRPIPQECPPDTEAIDYGPIREGVRVILGRHRPVTDDDDNNWDTEMSPYVGRTAAVTELTGADETGCPGIRVDVDQGRFFWRIRDLRLAR